MAEEQEVIYGQGIPTVADPSASEMTMIQDIVDDYQMEGPAPSEGDQAELGSSLHSINGVCHRVPDRSDNDDRAVLHIQGRDLSYG